MPPRLLFLFLLSLLHVSTSRGDIPEYGNCRVPLSFHCGSISLNISYPFLSEGRPDYCGHPGYLITCSAGKPTVQLSNGRVYLVKEINYRYGILTLAELDSTKGDACPGNLMNTSLDSSLFRFTSDDELLLLFSCKNLLPQDVSDGIQKISCNETNLHWYFALGVEALRPTFEWCTPTVEVRLHRTAAEELNGGGGWGDALSRGFDVGWEAGSGWCSTCLRSGGVCGYNSTDPASMTCFCRNGTRMGSCRSVSGSNSRLTRKLLVAFGSLVGGFLLALGVVYLWLRRQKGNTRSVSWKALVRSGSADPSPLDTDLEALGGFYHTHIFTYEELQEATGGFDSSKELGDGGFGVVYKGFLKDGRVVAVKRLHERNYHRVQQFRNEVEILNRIRHPNLVSLYGCTARDSHELLLVYEYVPNGTLADHLNGLLASENLLTWPRRFSIAVETAAALAYLHATQPQIIHRDIKTSNILLDNAFHVKVADFGLSRLFPSGMATHVTTAPQGTPGYVDPEYHQCYQLTDKSDVYSFGVVLVELISSKPAVDIDRPRSEINLSNIAMAKIPSGLVHELVDPTLGYDTDPGVKQTIDAMAELAFRCLQPEKDMRPSMDEVRETLVQMDGDQGKAPPESDFRTRDDASLLKSSESAAFSPVTVIGNWASISTNHSASP